MDDFGADYAETQAFCAELRATLKAYPRHVEGKIIQQGGFSILHEGEHKWRLAPDQVRALLAAAERYWATLPAAYPPA